MAWINSVKFFEEAEVQLEDWKEEFIDFLFEKGVLKFGTFKLKSGRRSPTFLNFGEVNDGVSISELSNFYSTAIQQYFPGDFKTILAPSYKGIPLEVAVSISLASKHGRNVNFTFDRKEEKAYGEATGVSKVEAAKKIFVGYIPKNGDKVLLLDDVITTGKTKDEEIDKLMSVVDAQLVGLILGGNRQELDEDGNDAVREFSERHNIPVQSMLNVNTEAVPYLASQGKVDTETKRRMIAYMRTYGTEDTKSWCRDVRLIQRDKGIIPACDVPFEKFEEIVRATADIDGVVAYKIPAISGRKGWEAWVSTARKHTQKPLIYDHQKAGTDIPDTGQEFMKEVKDSGFDAIIIFPESGSATQLEWIHSAFEQDLEVLCGGEMTHPKFKVSEGGYIDDNALVRMYLLSAKAGVNDFVVPGNRTERIKIYKFEIEKAIPGIKPAYHSPGLVTQDGKINEVTKLFSERWYGIVGRGVYGDVKTLGRYFTEKEMRDAAFEHVSQL